MAVERTGLRFVTENVASYFNTLDKVVKKHKGIGDSADTAGKKAGGLGKALGKEGMTMVRRLHRNNASDTPMEAAGKRALKNAMLPLLVMAKVPAALEFAQSQFKFSIKFWVNIHSINCRRNDVFHSGHNTSNGFNGTSST